MPDISMCPGEGCPNKESCYRYLAKPDKYWQAYFVGSPVKEDGTCDYYWKYNTKNNDNRKADRETS
jgi:hypothetical protein